MTAGKSSYEHLRQSTDPALFWRIAGRRSSRAKEKCEEVMAKGKIARAVIAAAKRGSSVRPRMAPKPPAGALIGRGRLPSLAVPMKGMARAPRAPIPFGQPRRRSPRPRVPAKPFPGR
jgi:hypothetical protein